MNIPSISSIENKKRIAIFDTSSVSFMQNLQQKCSTADRILKDYDLILIPGWVLTEISDSEISISYIENLIEKGYPIFRIEEDDYSSLADDQEWNLYQIVKASASRLGQIKSYLRRNIETDDPLDMDAYADWISRLYDEWPIAGNVLSSGRLKKKNAGEISITILAEVLSWYYPETDSITIYSQDNDTREFQSSAEEQLIKVFASKILVPISYKSNDSIICQLYRSGDITEEEIRDIRKVERKITYSKALADKSVILATELINTDEFIALIKDASVYIVF